MRSLPVLLQVIVFMPEINPSQMGGTMRLGARPTILKPTATTTASASGATTSGGVSLAHDLYGRDVKGTLQQHGVQTAVPPTYSVCVNG